jgi:hypothetical protein
MSLILQAKKTVNTDKLHFYGHTFMAARFTNMYEKTNVYRKLLKKNTHNLKWELCAHKWDNDLGKHNLK